MSQHIYSAVLIDDESKALNVLSYLLSATGKVKVICAETNPNLGLRQVVVQKPDLVFLDINMPEKDGLLLLKEINELSPESKVVIVSAYDDFVFKAFKLSATDFLVKPVLLDDLNEVLERIDQRVETEQKNKKASEDHQRMKFSTGSNSILLAAEDILFFKADGNYTLVITKDGREQLLTTGLGKIEDKLSQPFKRISRSSIINTSYLSLLMKGKRVCVIKYNELEYQVKASVNTFYELEQQFN